MRAMPARDKRPQTLARCSRRLSSPAGRDHEPPVVGLRGISTPAWFSLWFSFCSGPPGGERGPRDTRLQDYNATIIRGRRWAPWARERPAHERVGAAGVSSLEGVCWPEDARTELDAETDRQTDRQTGGRARTDTHLTINRGLAFAQAQGARGRGCRLGARRCRRRSARQMFAPQTVSGRSAGAEWPHRHNSCAAALCSQTNNRDSLTPQPCCFCFARPLERPREAEGWSVAAGVCLRQLVASWRNNWAQTVNTVCACGHCLWPAPQQTGRRQTRSGRPTDAQSKHWISGRPSATLRAPK